MKRCIALACLSLACQTGSAQQSLPVPHAIDGAGNKVLTFIGKDPPGQRCNGNLQVAAEIANVYRVSIQILPAGLAPGLPAPAVFYGNQLIAADGGHFNGQASYQMVADALEIEGVARHVRTGLLLQPGVRREFDALRSRIQSGGK